MPYQYIGRTTDFCGKPLWEIIGNLKNYGVGRLVIRNRFARYPEPCYYKILKVAALPNPVNTIRPTFINNLVERRCIVLVEKVFRGKKSDLLVQIDCATYKADYRLVPKDEEYKYINATESKPEVIYSKTMELPPLLREIAIRNMKAKGQTVTKEPEMDIVYNQSGFKFYKIAKDGETPTFTPKIGLGKPICPRLYANCKPI